MYRGKVYDIFAIVLSIYVKKLNIEMSALPVGGAFFCIGGREVTAEWRGGEFRVGENL